MELFVKFILVAQFTLVLSEGNGDKFTTIQKRIISAENSKILFRRNATHENDSNEQDSITKSYKLFEELPEVRGNFIDPPSLNSRRRRSPGSHGHIHVHSRGHIHVHSHGIHKREISKSNVKNLVQLSILKEASDEKYIRQRIHAKLDIHKKIDVNEAKGGIGEYLYEKQKERDGLHQETSDSYITVRKNSHKVRTNGHGHVHVHFHGMHKRDINPSEKHDFTKLNETLIGGKYDNSGYVEDSSNGYEDGQKKNVDIYMKEQSFVEKQENNSDGFTSNSREKRSHGVHTHSHGHIHVHTHGSRIR